MSIPVNSGDVYTDVSSLRNLKRDAAQGSPEALKKTAEQFEAIFLQMMLKSMRQTSSGDGMFDSDQSRFYQDMFDQQISINMAKKRQIGIADMLVKQLSKDQGAPVAEPQKGLKLDMERLRLSAQFQRLPTMPLAVSAVSLTTAPSTLAAATPATVTQLPSNSAPITNVGFDSPADFVEKLYALAEKYGTELGVEPKVLLAQSALETGWGRSVSRDANGISSNNLFNIKADKRWSGAQVTVKTLEYEKGSAVQQQAAFRAYPDFEASFRDYVAFLKSNPRYQQALGQTNNGPAFINALHEAGYATDPNYSTKINTLMKGDLLGDATARLQKLTQGPLT